MPSVEDRKQWAKKRGLNPLSVYSWWARQVEKKCKGDIKKKLPGGQVPSNKRKRKEPPQADGTRILLSEVTRGQGASSKRLRQDDNKADQEQTQAKGRSVTDGKDKDAAEPQRPVPIWHPQYLTLSSRIPVGEQGEQKQDEDHAGEFLCSHPTYLSFIPRSIMRAHW